MSKRSRIILILFCLVFHEIFSQGDFVKNYGFSFGFSLPLLPILQAILLLLVFKEKSKWKWLVISGGLVNLIDRLRLGYVRDYWFLPVVGVYNNLPDWLIFIGLVLICFSSLKMKKFW